MIHVIASIEVNPGDLDAFIRIFKANIPHVLAEKGCLGYEPTVDLKTDLPIQTREPSVVTVVEKWESLEALMAHMATPHMLDYKAKTKAMVVNIAIRILTPA